MTGYWPCSFFACLWTDEVEVDKFRKKRQKRKEANIPPSWPSKLGMAATNNNNKFAGKSQVIPSGQNKSILLARVANHNTGFTSSCSLARGVMTNNIIRMILSLCAQ